METEKQSPSPKKPVRKNRIPSKVSLSPHLHLKVVLLPSSDIQGQDGEFVSNLPPTPDGVAGIVRVDKGMTEQERWKTYRHELFHGLVDVHEWVNDHGDGSENDEETKDSS